jgi:predicted amidohydrolase YtcJ
MDGAPLTPLAAYNGALYTMDEARPRAEALFAAGGRLVHVGTNEEVRALAARWPACRALDLEGRCVLPGFTDSHIHFLNLGLALDRVDLSGVASLETVLERIGAAARGSEARGGTAWVHGGGWDHSLWPGQRFPDKTLLDRVARHAPVALRRKDGHMAWLNSAALAAASIRRDTPDPPGGRVGRDADGEPNGLLFEAAMALVDRTIPEPGAAEAEGAIRRAMAHVHRLGVTGIHVPEGPLAFGAFQRLEARGDLKLRVCMMLAHDQLDAALATGLRSRFGGDRLRVGPLKIFADGSLGSETAAMLEPFEGSSTNRGILRLPEAELASAVERAARGGIGCAVHAIGDRANRIVLDAFQVTRAAWQPAGLRQRIEHVQVLHPDDLARLAGLGVIASMQPIHCTQDMDLVDRLWGARGRYAYAFRSLLAGGARLAFGSDAPVETPDPLAGLYAAVSRRRADGRPPGGWYPEERLSVTQAVHAYTLGAAYAAGAEAEGGSLTPGKHADLVVLSKDIMAAPAAALLAARVTHTVVAGEVVYAA